MYTRTFYRLPATKRWQEDKYKHCFMLDASNLRGFPISLRKWYSHHSSLVTWVPLCLISCSLRLLILQYECAIILNSTNHTGIMWSFRLMVTANAAPEAHNSEYPCHYPHFIPFPFPTITEIYCRQLKNDRNRKNTFRHSLPLSEHLWKIEALLKHWGLVFMEVEEVSLPLHWEFSLCPAFPTRDFCTFLKGTLGWERYPGSDPIRFLVLRVQATACPGHLPKAKRTNL